MLVVGTDTLRVTDVIILQSTNTRRQNRLHAHIVVQLHITHITHCVIQCMYYVKGTCNTIIKANGVVTLGLCANHGN